MFAILQVLISPVVRLYNLFISLRDEQIMNQAGTSQVCMLQKIVHDQLNLSIEIEESNGLSTDFIVKCDSLDLDKERRLVALVSKYKLAGKSFLLNNASVVFTQVWGNYACEKAMLAYNFGGYVCELAVKQLNVLTIDYWKDVAGNTGFYLSAALSPVEVTLVCEIVDPQNGVLKEEKLITHVRQTVDPSPVTILYPVVQEQDGELKSIRLLIPEDDIYIYELYISTWPNIWPNL